MKHLMESWSRFVNEAADSGLTSVDTAELVKTGILELISGQLDGPALEDAFLKFRANLIGERITAEEFSAACTDAMKMISISTVPDNLDSKLERIADVCQQFSEEGPVDEMNYRQEPELPNVGNDVLKLYSLAAELAEVDLATVMKVDNSIQEAFAELQEAGELMDYTSPEALMHAASMMGEIQEEEK